MRLRQPIIDEHLLFMGHMKYLSGILPMGSFLAESLLKILQITLIPRENKEGVCVSNQPMAIFPSKDRHKRISFF